MEAFVYCWSDHLTKKLYIGSHKGAPDDGYICSSRLMKEEYHKRPLDFTRQILATGAYKDMHVFEHKLLSAFDVKNNPSFYNQHNGNGQFYLKGHTEISKRKISASQKGKVNSQEARKKMSVAKSGKPLTEAHKEKLSMTWVVTFPDGHVETITNLRAFCRIHSLNPSHLHSTTIGRYKHHKGYKAIKSQKSQNSKYSYE